MDFRKLDTRAAIVIGVIALPLVGALAGIIYGERIGRTEARAAVAVESRAISERDAKILAVIVKRNPNATIREFAGFPALLVEESQKRGLDYRYVMAIIEKESEWNPRAVSPVGAIGLMQVMPATALLVVKNTGMEGFEPARGKELGSLADPAWNVRIGLAHLKGLIDSYGLGPEHLRAYNRGDVAARAHWPADRYAEDIALKYVRLSAVVPR